MIHEKDYVANMEEIHSLLDKQAQRIDNLQAKLNETEKLVDFLSEYNKDDIVVCCQLTGYIPHTVAKYIHNGKLCITEFEHHYGCYPQLISNNPSTAIFSDGGCLSNSYYILDKQKGTIIKIENYSLIQVDNKKDIGKTKVIKSKKGE